MSWDTEEVGHGILLTFAEAQRAHPRAIADDIARNVGCQALADSAAKLRWASRNKEKIRLLQSQWAKRNRNRINQNRRKRWENLTDDERQEHRNRDAKRVRERRAACAR